VKGTALKLHEGQGSQRTGADPTPPNEKEMVIKVETGGIAPHMAV